MSLTKEDLLAIEELLDARLDAKLEPINKRFDAIENRLDTIENRLDAIESDIEMLMDEVGALTLDVGLIRRDMEEMKDNYVSILRDVTHHNLETEPIVHNLTQNWIDFNLRSRDLDRVAMKVDDHDTRLRVVEETVKAAQAQ